MTEIEKDYGFTESTEVIPSSGTQVEQSKAVQEIQAALVVAKKFPRNETEAFARIMKACERPQLAEKARYAFPRGNKMVTGPSIRLAEVLKRAWGNMRSGLKEVSRDKSNSTVKAFCWDLETNDYNEIEFQVKHWRDTKDGGYALTDERDIYELIANQGARRTRKCILAEIPGDVIEAALEKCKKTLASGKEPLEDRVRKSVMAFDTNYGIKVEHIEKRLGHNLSSIIEEELIMLGDIFNSLRDGMAKREDFFDFGVASTKSHDEVSKMLETKKAVRRAAQEAKNGNPSDKVQSNEEFLSELNGDKK